MPRNPIVEEVREIRRRLTKEYGGFDGYFDHLLEFQKTLDQSKKAAPKPRTKTQKRAVTAKATKPQAKRSKKAVKTTVAKRSAKRKAS